MHGDLFSIISSFAPREKKEDARCPVATIQRRKNIGKTGSQAPSGRSAGRTPIVHHWRCFSSKFLKRKSAFRNTIGREPQSISNGAMQKSG